MLKISKPVHLWQFTGWFTVYIVLSLAIYFSTSFTIPAWLLYIFALFPFCALCVLFLISLSFKQSKTSCIKYRPLLIVPMVLFQILAVISSPTSCVGWKQGERCYSFIQTHLDQIDHRPDHWIQDGIFLLALLLYIAAIFIFLATARVEKRDRDRGT